MLNKSKSLAIFLKKIRDLTVQVQVRQELIEEQEQMIKLLENRVEYLRKELQAERGGTYE